MTRIEEIKARQREGQYTYAWPQDVDWLLERNAELMEAAKTAQNELGRLVYVVSSEDCESIGMVIQELEAAIAAMEKP